MFTSAQEHTDSRVVETFKGQVNPQTPSIMRMDCSSARDNDCTYRDFHRTAESVSALSMRLLRIPSISFSYTSLHSIKRQPAMSMASVQYDLKVPPQAGTFHLPHPPAVSLSPLWTLTPQEHSGQRHETMSEAARTGWPFSSYYKVSLYCFPSLSCTAGTLPHDDGFFLAGSDLLPACFWEM